MDLETLRTDPISALLEMEGDSAKILPDQENGYDRVVPTPELLEHMASVYSAQILQTDKDYEPQWKILLQNENAYEGISEGDETITIPICKRITNQQTAFLSSQILSKNPIISCKPIDGGSYEIPADATGDPNQPTLSMETLSSEDAAKLFEAYLQYKLTRKLDFGQLIEDTVFAIHVGEQPTWWKIPYDPKVRHAKRRKLEQADPTNPKKKKVTGIEDYTIEDGESVRIDHLSNVMVTMPMGEHDPQTASWLSEKRPMSNSDIWQGIKSKRFDFCQEKEADTEQIKKVLGMSENLQEGDVAQALAAIDRRVASDPQKLHDVREVWFFYPIKRTIETIAPPDPMAAPMMGEGEMPMADAMSGVMPMMAPPKKIQTETIEIRSLCGTLHVRSKTWLNIYVNPYWHGKRPYIPFFMRKRPHRFSGASSVGDTAPIQKLVSQIFHLQIQNGVQQNVKLFPIRNNTVTWRWFEKRGGRVAPGDRIPYDDPTDIAPIQLGQPVQSMANEITFLSGEADRLAVERDYTDIPGRTPAATMAQFESMAKMQPQSILRGIRRRISDAIVMYLQTVAQFHQYETIPFLDPATNKTIRKLIGFPRETIENHFAFDVTATGDDDTPQARIEKTTLLLQQTDMANESTLKLMMIALDPMQPPPSRAFAKTLLVRREQLYGDLVQAQRPDWAKFAVTEQMVTDMMMQADQLFAQAQAAQAGAANEQGVSSTGPGGAVSDVPPGQPGPGQFPAQPPDAGMALQDAPGDPFGGGPVV